MRTQTKTIVVFSAVIAASLLGPRAAVAQAPAGELRVLPDKAELARVAPGTTVNRIAIKFREGSAIDSRAGRLSGAQASEVAALTAALASVGVQPGSLQPLYPRPAAELDRERQAGIARGGRELPDLKLYFILDVASGQDGAAILRRISELPIVEYAEPVLPPAPPPADIAPPTPSLTGWQGYLTAPPTGIGAFTSAVVGGDGTNMRVVDIEYSWVLNHEDLELPPSANIDSFTLSDPFASAHHGTAVLGVLGGRRNAYGVTGIAPAATMLVAPAYTAEGGYNIARAINLAASRLQAGDVILLEQQNSVCGSTSYGPVEGSQIIYDAIAQATSLGIVVVEAAGNGAVNLDDPLCLLRFDRTVRDSRAIIVGAGHPSIKSRLSFSTYGSRVDVQGWGQEVTTTGYGNAFYPATDAARQLYTHGFSGTSSASTIVAGSVLALQGALKGRGLRVATPLEIREALALTGTPQTGTTHIGPLPNLAAALGWLVARIGGGRTWRTWESFSGSLLSNPECLNTSSTQTDCWAKLASGALGWWRYDGSSAPSVVSLGGQVNSPPSCVVAGGKLQCFVALLSNQLGQITRTGNVWGSWTSLGDNIRRRPACVSVDGTKITCVAVSGDNKLRTRNWSGATWDAWKALATNITTTESPTCLARAGGIDCVLADTASNLRYLRRDASGIWSSPTTIGAGVAGLASCIAPSATARTCFIRGSNGTLRSAHYDGMRWAPLENLGGSVSTAPTCVWSNNTDTHCFAVAADGTLQQKRKTSGGWQAWVGLGGTLFLSRPACVAPTGTRLDCFARAASNALAHRAYR
jgi:serine protease